MADPALQFALPDSAELAERAQQTARSCAWLPGRNGAPRINEIYRKSLRRLRTLESELYSLRSGEPSDDLQWLYDNLRLVHTELQDLRDSGRALGKLPAVRTETEDAIPRCLVLARNLLASTKYSLTQEKLAVYAEAVQQVEPLRLAELANLLLALKLAILELLAQRGRQALDAFRKDGKEAPSFDIGPIIRSLRFLGEQDWREMLEELSIVHRTLKADPAGVYCGMDLETRANYRSRVATLAAHSDLGEIEIARLAVEFAGAAASPEQELARHVGYYLIDGVGSKEFLHRITYRPALNSLTQRFFRRFPDEIYIIGIEFVTLITVVAIVMSLVNYHQAFHLVLAAIALLLPATQAAVELVNYLVTTVLNAHPLPKMDFSKGVPAASATIVAVPTLLISEKQVQQLVDDLEIRYLVNKDPHIYYALLTDLPDSAEPAVEADHRIDLAIELIHGLNRKYAGDECGGFYLFHRHRIYNPRESAWMGWERKRGKLLDLNQYLRTDFDPFPVKAGDFERFPRRAIRYVLTLDSDSQLPRSSAQRLIGAMAHPLNRPIIDSELNIVTRGYGILQPRVGISVHTSATSRLARIYSGQTGFDIYSRAVSDVYQDLYGEGIFTGKGIYDIDALRAVLERRFPRNALLSHDLIEGAYARAGLASDIEVIDDYPSHYSAYNRRKHRWLRGDWQIVRWILNRVPDETRHLVRNPISLVSRWKIVDNLRRSLMEPAIFGLFVAGWFVLPGGPRYWTIVTLALLFLPIYFRLLFALTRAALALNARSMVEAFEDFISSHAAILLNIAFVAHQALVSIDAIVRTLIRTYVTHRSLLEWETATEAELGIRKRTPVDTYLDWLPVLCIALAGLVFLRPEAAPWAAPFIVVWCFSKLLSKWLNRSPLKVTHRLASKDIKFLRDVAARTWHYFATYSNESNHWLIPDNVQEEPFRVAERISPTNLGLLLNARQAALEFGFIELAEFVALTERTMETMGKLPRFHGHFVNWYDTITLKALDPPVISSVDNGNFIASLWSLRQGCLEKAAGSPEFAERLGALAAQCERFSKEMDFGVLVDERRSLLSIGYNLQTQTLNKSCYDLLASEARIASFVAVAKNDAPQDCWFRLGRQHTLTEKESVLVSWTGTMFEYLMPLIWMRSHPGTLLTRSAEAAVRVQQEYGNRRGILWGISESAYAKTDEHGNYQYAAFGVPGLALNVARAGFLITSPYATCLALMVDPAAAVDNLCKMQRAGWLTKFGFYEAADYSASQQRWLRSRRYEVIRSFMAHHQGMSLTAICNVLHEQPFQRWFHSERAVQASELILNERPLRARPVADLQPKRVVNFGAVHAPESIH